jgi:hypothetical protein
MAFNTNFHRIANRVPNLEDRLDAQQ